MGVYSNHGMNDQDQIYIDSVQEQIKSGMYDHLLVSHEMVFLDIGANIGEVSKYFHRYCKRIVAIEPAPETFKLLQKNVDRFRNIECLDVALAPENGPRKFFVNDINFTASSTVNTYGQKIMVRGKTLATILRENDLTHVDVCKCDAEGAEGEALNYYEIDAAKDIIKQWFIEVHNCPLTTWEHKLGTLVGNLARCGYSKMTIDGMAITATK